MQKVFCTKSSEHNFLILNTMWSLNTVTINGRLYSATRMSGLQGSVVAEGQCQSDVIKLSMTKLVDSVCELEEKVRLTH